MQWAWVDSLLTDAKGTYDQLVASRENQIEQLEDDIKSGKEKAQSLIEEVEEALNNPTRKNIKSITKKLRGIKNKILKTSRNIEKLAKLNSRDDIKVCFGSSKLFKKQFNLKENGYNSHQEWLVDWRKSRGGNFYSVGKGATPGNNRVTKIFHKSEDIFICQVQTPRYLQTLYGEYVEVDFEVTGQRKHDLLYALESHKPVTIQIFRREHKEDKWYIHLTTYVQQTPTVHTRKNGCIGVDLNAISVDVIYIKPDGNPGVFDGKFAAYSFPLNPNWSTDQRKAALRDIAAQMVQIAESLNCSIALENLDFTKKKNALRNSGSKKYNKMLSGLVYDGLRCAIVSRAEKRGVQIIFINPALTSVIGCLKYQQIYGLNSAFSAAMVIARKALGLKERIPKFVTNLLSLPADREKAGGGDWWKVNKLLKKCKISRHAQFNLSAIFEVLKDSLKPKKRTRKSRNSRSKGKPTATLNSAPPVQG